ncbi:MAG: bifunctional 3-deoxy-7-phosphoheptulonate synthase/chorismate mutase type II [Muribaculaceae bacterium]|jgi:chorismate mutase|nr:bifunctional 3-deoxy-7-phosphoheptulonate synthase/chorismate mutase type II [Muribaculaceae bacterium]
MSAAPTLDLDKIDFAEKDVRPVVIAGPCSAESEEQMMFTAIALKQAGIRVLRAGAWKPRTKPGCFEGYGEQALKWIVKAARCCGMLSATEVATAAHVYAALGAGIDVLWIGARTTANPFAMQEVADTLRACSRNVPVLVKNPVSPDLELWIGALERLNKAGMTRLMAVHRGFSSYGEHNYRNSPIWRVPIELHRRLPDLPVLCDPSHISGRSETVGHVAQQAMDMGFDGLMVECHCCPSVALSDARQQLTPQELEELLRSLKLRKRPDPSSADIMALRSEIDRIDDRLLALLVERMNVSDEIGRHKLREGMAVVQHERYNDLMDRRAVQAEDAGLNPDFVRSLIATIHEESVRRQLGIVNNG